MFYYLVLLGLWKNVNLNVDLGDVFICHFVNHYSLHVPYGKMGAPKFIKALQVFLFNIKTLYQPIGLFFPILIYHKTLNYNYHMINFWSKDSWNYKFLSFHSIQKHHVTQPLWKMSK